MCICLHFTEKKLPRGSGGGADLEEGFGWVEKEEKEMQEEERAVTASAEAEKIDSSTENPALRNDSVIFDKTRNMSHDSRHDSFMCDKTRRTSHDLSTETKVGALGMSDGASENKVMLCQGRGGRASER